MNNLRATGFLKAHSHVIWFGMILTLGIVSILIFGQHASVWGAHGQAILAVQTIVHPDGICTIDHAPSKTGFFILLSAGLLTGLSHCVGMCGPLVSAFAMRRRAIQREVSTPLVLYQMGRLSMYMLLGAGMGAIGGIINVVPLIRGGQGVIAAIFGILLILMGTSLLGWLPTRYWIESSALARALSQWIRRLLTADHPLAPFTLGVANGLLPCGAIYAMSVLAMSTTNALHGAMIMLIFGLGTLPAMLGVGLSVSMFSLRIRRGLFQLAAIFIVLIGVQLILRGLALNGLMSHISVGGLMLW